MILLCEGGGHIAHVAKLANGFDHSSYVAYISFVEGTGWAMAVYWKRSEVNMTTRQCFASIIHS